MVKKQIYNRMKICIVFITLILSMSLLAACGKEETPTVTTLAEEMETEKIVDGVVTTEEDKEDSYSMITMADAKTIFETEGDYIILDVRRADEYADGHIPGAMNIANEDIGDEVLEELPDLDQTIYVYCRSGNRSKQAAAKLVNIGYSNIIEFGGIIDWTGDVER